MWYRFQSPRLTFLVAVAAFVVFVVSSAASCAPDTSNCGPRCLCKCTWIPHTELSSEVKTMDCSGKGLASLGEICETVGKATRLLVNNSHISGTLEDDSRLDRCGDLLSLSLRGNQIVDLEPKAVARLAKLRTLDLSHNKLIIFKQNKGHAFSNLSDLKYLALNGNHVNKSDLCQFYPDLSGNMKLETLLIDGLPICDKEFPKIVSLKTLIMSGVDGICSIQSISSSLFIHLVNLEALSMVKCDIVKIDLNGFSALRKLQRLDISQNRRLGMRASYNVSYSLQFTNIKFVNYSYNTDVFGLGNKITKRDACFLRNTSLQELALDGNRLQLMEPNTIQLLPPTLQILHVNDNTFTFGPYLLQLACLSNLTEVYANFQNLAHSPMLYTDNDDDNKTDLYYPKECPFMEDSYLKNVSDHAENCIFFDHKQNITIFPSFPRTVRKVMFHDCNMKFRLIKMMIIPLENRIEHLDASGNVFYSWDGPLGPFPKLKYFDLSRNYCSRIKRSFFEYFKRLENLQLHSNFIGLTLSNDFYTDVFHDLVHLRKMNLSMNKITSLHPQTFEGLRYLTTLDLSLNSIETWDIDVATLAELTHVNLSSNAIQSLPGRLTKHLYSSARHRNTSFTIDLRQNSLRYGCQTKEFLKFMMQHKDSFVGFEEYIFLNDDGVRIANIDIVNKVLDLEKKCRSYTVWIVISVIGVSVSLAIIVNGFVYKNRWKLRYFLYMSKQRFYGYVRIPNEQPVENYKYDAFISYAEENIRFVKNEVIPKIEQNTDISLCIHQRDFLPGNAIADNIIDAIKSSRKTVVLLSKAFLKRKWCIYEFNMARMESIYSREGVSSLVVVMLEPVPTRDLPVELLEWIKSESYLEYSTDQDGSRLFWGNFVEAIKH